MITTDTVLADRYQIEGLLSQKAGRQTFLAKDLQSQIPVIIKLLRFGDTFEWDDLKLFEREAATLKNLNHPEIPKYLDYFEVDQVDTSGFALVQSYIEAPSLETLITRGRKFSEAEIFELTNRLLDLLAYLHQQCPPVIHRDIKPSNILLDNRSGNSIGNVYLVDFGSVQTVAKKEQGTITIVGSYGYIPLEQFGGQATTASDLYSLGMTLIYLLTGTHPAELPQVEGRVKFNAEISKRFERWLDKMTSPHLDKRFASAKVAQLALKSEDGSYGELDQLKPSHTQIQLYRDRSRLQITWHEENPVNSGCGCLLVIWFTVVVIMQIAGSGTLVATLALCFAASIFVAKLIRLILFVCGLLSSQTKYHLVIDEIRICKLQDRGQGHESIKISEHPRSQAEIVAYNPGYTFDKCLDTEGRLIKGGVITISPKLYLYCGNFEYSFPAKSSHATFSQAELWWLGEEISDFLNCELQIIYPTPNVPPASSCGGGC